MRNFLRPRPGVALTAPVKRLFLKICRALHRNSRLPAAGSAPAQIGSLQAGSVGRGPDLVVGIFVVFEIDSERFCF